MASATQLAQRSGDGKMAKVLKAILMVLVVAGAMVVASYAAISGAESGSKTQLAISLLIAILPLLLYFATIKPFVFPFALFVILVPIDNLLGINAGSGATGSSQHVATVTKLLGLASGLAFTLWLVRKRHFIMPPRAALLWMGLLVWMTLSIFWAIDANVAVAQLTTYAELIMLYILISIMPIAHLEFKSFLAAVVLGALVAAAYGIHQYHAHGNAFHGAQLAEVLNSHVRTRERHPEIDPNALTAALLLPIAIVMMAIMQCRWSPAKFAFIGMLLVLLGGVYVTASRGGLVALGVLLVYLALRSRYRLQVVIFSLLALGASLTRGISHGSMWGRFADAVKTGGSGRLSIWGVAWDSFKHHWLVGAGVGNFPIAYNQSYIHIYSFFNQGWSRASHNTPLGLAVELGAVGLGLVAVATYQQWKMLGFINKGDPLYDLRIALEGAFVALVVASIFLWVVGGKYAWLTLELMAATRAFALGRTGWHDAGPLRQVNIADDDRACKRVPPRLLTNA